MPRRPRVGVDKLFYSFFNLGARWEWVVNAKPRPLYRRERSGTNCVGGAVVITVGLEGAEKLAPPPTGIRSLDRPVRIKSLHRLRFPSPAV